MSHSPIDAMKWRYATKQFDTTKKLTAEQLNTLKEVMRLSPSCYGLQPWKFIQVDDFSTRAKLREAAWGQPQVTDASHFFVLASRTEMDTADAALYVDAMAQHAEFTDEQKAGMGATLEGFIGTMTPESSGQWAARQVYIPLGVLLATAAHEKIDAAPMEGFDAAQFDAILGLEGTGYTSRVVCAIGFRLDSDPAAFRPKVRFGQDEVFEIV